jgi:hypothetical protein
MMSLTHVVFQGGPLDDQRLNHQTLGEPFPVKATVRSPAHAKLIEEEAAKYEHSFSTFENLAQ